MLAGQADDELIAALTGVPGIGPWTAQGALIIALGREDVVLARAHLALRKAIRAAYRLDHLPTPDEVRSIAESWRPYRSLATAYLFSTAFADGTEPARANRHDPVMTVHLPRADRGACCETAHRLQAWPERQGETS